MSGPHLEAIFVAPAARAPMEAVEVARLCEGAGIEGDRYANRAGTFSEWPRDHELTLVEAEVLESVTAEYGLILAPGETRRNLVTRGIALNPFVGKRFRVGGVLCEGTRLCEPCAHLEVVTGKGGLARILAGRGGLRARVLETGVVRVGDVVVQEAPISQVGRFAPIPLPLPPILGAEGDGESETGINTRSTENLAIAELPFPLCPQNWGKGQGDGGKDTLIALLALLIVTLPAAAAPPQKGKLASAKQVPAKRVPKPPLPPPPPPKPVSPSPLWSISFSPDGTQFAVGSYRRVLVYDAATGAKKGDYVVSREAIRAIAFSPDGKWIAAGTGIPAQSGSVIILEAATGKPVHTLGDRDDTIEALAWADNTTLLSAADDEKVDVTDVGANKMLGKLAEHQGRCLAVTVPTKTTDQAGGAIFVTGGADKMIKVWDAQARRVVVNFDQAASPVWSLAAAQSRPGFFVAGTGDGKLRYFSVRTVGKGDASEGNIAQRSGSLERTVEAHTGAVYAVAVSVGDAFLVSCGEDGKVIQWKMYGGKMHEWTDAKRDVWGAAIAPDGKHIAAASLDGRARLYDATTGALVFTVDANGVVLPPAPPTPFGPPSPVTPLAPKPAPSASVRVTQK